MRGVLAELGIERVNSGVGTGSSWLAGEGEPLDSVSPIDGQVLASVRQASQQEYKRMAGQAVDAFGDWRQLPVPERGEIVRQIGEAVRARKKALGELVTLECGKILTEGEGEVQEMIDICDFAVGQSRMLYGLSMHSERPRHRMYEQWHPLGPVGVITAFNFPVAVLAWNAMIALIAGDTVIWKPSHKVPLTAIALTRIIGEVLKTNGLSEGIFSLVIGDRLQVGEPLVADRRIPLISATGSVAMGRHVAQSVAARLGRSLLELGGNSGVIVTERADLDLAVRAILFGAVGTAGQRCTTTRRLIVHDDIADKLLARLVEAYRQVRIGNPLDPKVLMGPLIDRQAVEQMQQALDSIRQSGGEILHGGEVVSGGIFDVGTYVTPAIASVEAGLPLLCEETFAPILYVLRYRCLEDAIALHNGVPQGLSSAIFTDDLCQAETFLAAAGSDCGIANVNIGTSGAEIGGAFGGEKETGGGREAGSDAWKAYMRRQTSTINWSRELPLAQGVRFGDD